MTEDVLVTVHVVSTPLVEQIACRLETNGLGLQARNFRLLYASLTSHKVANLDKWLPELFHRTNDAEQFLDIFTQGKAAHVLAFNGFLVTMNPTGSKGPDLQIEDGQNVVRVEVLRLHPGLQEQRARDESLETSGIYMLAVAPLIRRLASRIEEKNKQGAALPRNIAYVVYVYIANDSVVGVREFRWAIKGIQSANRQAPAILKSIGGVVLDVGTVPWPRGRSLHFWLNHRVQSTRPIDASLAIRLKSMKGPNDPQARQAIRRLAEAVRRRNLAVEPAGREKHT